MPVYLMMSGKGLGKGIPENPSFLESKSIITIDLLSYLWYLTARALLPTGIRLAGEGSR